MPLNILHHKSFNVYNQDNIDTVKKDEEKQREEEKKKELQRRTAEAEIRLDRLRSKAKKRKLVDVNDEDNSGLVGNTTVPVASDDTNDGKKALKRFNLFGEEESIALANQRRNADAEREKQEEKERLERKMTIWHLDSGTKDIPWYSKQDVTNDVEKKKNLKEKHDDRRKYAADPLRVMEKSTEKLNYDKPVANTTKTKRPNSKMSKMEKLRHEQRMREQSERERKFKLLQQKQQQQKY